MTMKRDNRKQGGHRESAELPEQPTSPLPPALLQQQKETPESSMAPAMESSLYTPPTQSPYTRIAHSSLNGLTPFRLEKARFYSGC